MEPEAVLTFLILTPQFYISAEKKGKRARLHCYRAFSFSKGEILQKSGENPEQAVVRKLLEETNIKDKFIKEKSNKGVSFEKGNSLDKKSLDKRGDWKIS